MKVGGLGTCAEKILEEFVVLMALHSRPVTGSPPLTHATSPGALEINNPESPASRSMVFP
jgi:hypothetical protein